MNGSLKSAVWGLVLCGAFLVGDPSQAQNTQQPAPDNTAVNKRDRSNQQPTADQSKNNMSDREMARNIRRDIVKDKSLSTYGHNVKVICDHGKVTLKGPVHSDDEKRAIEEHARKYAGDGNVNNELEVKGDTDHK
jgi:osmotically-inducible protein OsmY